MANVKIKKAPYCKAIEDMRLEMVAKQKAKIDAQANSYVVFPSCRDCLPRTCKEYWRQRFTKGK